MKSNDRFIVSCKEGNSLKEFGQRIIFVDRETGVNYLWIQIGYSGGLTPILDNNGNPIITEVKI